MKVSLLIVEAGVRYWEDATVNGVDDEQGDLIPFREGALWKPVIELASGKIRDWPPGMTAKIHYKVCDAGNYFLADEDGKKLMYWSGDYVPDRWLCWGDTGYGDYIILTVDGSGKIDGWKTPDLFTDEWDAIHQDMKTAEAQGWVIRNLS